MTSGIIEQSQHPLEWLPANRHLLEQACKHLSQPWATRTVAKFSANIQDQILQRRLVLAEVGTLFHRSGVPRMSWSLRQSRSNFSLMMSRDLPIRGWIDPFSVTCNKTRKCWIIWDLGDKNNDQVSQKLKKNCHSNCRVINSPKFQGPRGSLLTLLALLNLFHIKTFINMPIQNTAIFVGCNYSILSWQQFSIEKLCYAK